MTHSGDQRRQPLRGWALSCLGVAVAVTAVEAYLLDRKKGFLTGGFLADQVLDSAGELVAFWGGSLLADVGTVGALAAGLFAVVRYLRLPPNPSWLISAMLAGAFLGAGDVIQFELDKYLGSGFDLALMYELAGRDPWEFLAVAWAHLLAISVIAAVGLVLAIGVGNRVARVRARSGRSRANGVGHLAPIVGLAVSVFVVSVIRLSSADADDALRRKPSVAWAGSLIDTISDIDRDGYGILGRPSDPSPLDGRVYPYAVDVPGNGVDEDGLLGDLPAGTLPWADPGRQAPWASRRHIVLVVLESVRADAVGATHNGRPVTPVLDALASGGVSASNAWSHNGYTVQSRHHLFSGTLGNAGDGTSLIDDFVASGYEVAYISAQDDTFGSASMDVGFRRASFVYTARDEPSRRYTRFATPGSLAVPFTVVEEKTAAFLDRRDRARPVFLYLNFHDTHFPYHHGRLEPIVNDAPLSQRDIGPATRDRLRATYLNAVANVDAAIGRVLERVRSSVEGEVGVIVVSDHGESLYDGGFLGHGYALDEAQTRIPLVVNNVPMTIEEPWGQSQLRWELGEALRKDPGQSSARPTIAGRGTVVFQYLGGLSRPRQVAWRTKGRVVAYDFRDRRGTLHEPPDGSAVVVSDLERASGLKDVILLWERMRLSTARR